MPISEAQRNRIRSQLKNRRKTKAFKQPSFPHMIEMEYGKAIIKEVKKIDDLVKEILLPELSRLTGHKEERFDRNIEFRHLTGIALVTALINKIKGAFYGEILREDSEPNQNLFTRSIRRMAKPFLERTKDKTEVQFVKEFERQTGTTPIPEQINVDEFVNESLARNVNLIKTIPARHLSEVDRLTREAVSKGELSTTLREKITESSKKSKNNARLIARDQIGKLVGNIEEARQRKLGVKNYIWRTSQDSRVRSFSNTNGSSDHKRLEGTIQKWSDPPVTVFRGKRAGSKNHPGQDIQCRCHPEAVYDELTGIEHPNTVKAREKTERAA